MKTLTCRLLLAVVVVLTDFSLCAELVWTQRQFDFRTKLNDIQATGEFPFKNTGKSPVTILSIKPDCSSCTITDLPKKQYQPGQNGTLKATFVFGDRVGQQVKTITVETDDPKNPVTVLTLSVFIPELLKITPSALYWQTGKDKLAKTIDLKAASESPVKIVRVDSSHEAINTELKKVKDGKEYQIVVQPIDVSEPAKAILTILTDFPKENPKTFKAYAYIKSPKSTAEFLEVTPEYVYWERGEEPKPKSFTVKILNPKPVKVVGVESSEPQLLAKLKPVKPDKEYVIEVTPLDTKKPVKSTITIETDLPTNKPIFSATAVVK